MERKGAKKRARRRRQGWRARRVRDGLVRHFRGLGPPQHDFLVALRGIRWVDEPIEWSGSDEEIPLHVRSEAADIGSRILRQMIHGP